MLDWRERPTLALGAFRTAAHGRVEHRHLASRQRVGQPPHDERVDRAHADHDVSGRGAVDDPALAELKLSGVFESGDTQAFAEAVQSYLPVVADTSESGTIHLRTR